VIVAQAAQAALFAKLEELELREQEVSARRRRLHARLDSFPNEVTAEEERRISSERRELHREIDQLRARLKPELDRRDQEPPAPRIGA